MHVEVGVTPHDDRVDVEACRDLVATRERDGADFMPALDVRTFHLDEHAEMGGGWADVTRVAPPLVMPPQRSEREQAWCRAGHYHTTIGEPSARR